MLPCCQCCASGRLIICTRACPPAQTISLAMCWRTRVACVDTSARVFKPKAHSMRPHLPAAVQMRLQVRGYLQRQCGCWGVAAIMWRGLRCSTQPTSCQLPGCSSAPAAVQWVSQLSNAWTPSGSLRAPHEPLVFHPSGLNHARVTSQARSTPYRRVCIVHAGAATVHHDPPP